MRSTINISCSQCGKDFLQLIKFYNLNKKRGCKNYCSIACSNASRNTQIQIECEHCKKISFKKIKDVKRTKHNFCSLSCSTSFHNLHKTQGYRRSKLELYLETKLKNKYGENFLKFNDHTTINSELDILIPSLKLAFELNGILHYEPIYGENKLRKIKNNDERKFQACIEKKISLCIIDASTIKYFKESTADKFFNLIVGIIDKIVAEGGVEPPTSTL
jgi:hypothetical protein